FVAIVGRPNTGKSTLINALVGQKVAITSHHPNTTRHAIRGIVNGDGFQAILVDTPGLHKPRTLLGQRLNQVVQDNLSDVDLILVTLPANEEFGSGDQFILDLIKDSKAKKFALVTKIDTVAKDKLPLRLTEIGSKADWAEIIPISAVKNLQIDIVRQLLSKYLSEGPVYYPESDSSDQSKEQLICELIREAAIQGVRQELPHSIAVTIDEYSKREDKDLIDIHATIHVERDSQRGILLGHKGQMLKEIGSLARREIEQLLGSKCFLGLHIKVSKEWQKDAKALEKLGYSDSK
ncbi:MAG: GTPase Era, partial [Candidatus Nanopelagicaceae bacterium]